MPKYFSIKKNEPKWKKIQRDFPFVKYVYISSSFYLYGCSLRPNDIPASDYAVAGLCYVGYFDGVDFAKLYSLSDSYGMIERMPTPRSSEQKTKELWEDGLFDLAYIISRKMFGESSFARTLTLLCLVETEEAATRERIREILVEEFSSKEALLEFLGA